MKREQFKVPLQQDTLWTTVLRALVVRIFKGVSRMRKLLCCAAALLFLASLTACTRQQAVETGSTPLEIAQTVMDSQTDLPKFYYLTPEDEEFSNYLSGYYQIHDGQVEDGVICYAAGAEASEIAVLRMADEAAGRHRGGGSAALH